MQDTQREPGPVRQRGWDPGSVAPSCHVALTGVPHRWTPLVYTGEKGGGQTRWPSSRKGSPGAERALGVGWRKLLSATGRPTPTPPRRTAGQPAAQPPRGGGLAGLHRGAADQQHPCGLARLHGPPAHRVQGPAGQGPAQDPARAVGGPSPGPRGLELDDMGPRLYSFPVGAPPAGFTDCLQTLQGVPRAWAPNAGRDPQASHMPLPHIFKRLTGQLVLWAAGQPHQGTGALAAGLGLWSWPLETRGLEGLGSREMGRWGLRGSGTSRRHRGLRDRPRGLKSMDRLSPSLAW